MCRKPHTFAVDYFALGVLAYEFILGRVIYLLLNLSASLSRS